MALHGEPAMSTDSSKLNGSIERLGIALRDVVKEGVAEANEPMRGQIADVRKDVQEVEERFGNRSDRAVEDIVAERQMEKVS